MTVRIAVSLPDDVAERLALEPNVSRFVAEAVRHQIRRERSLALLNRVGITLGDGDEEAGLRRITDDHGAVTPELAEQADARLARWRRR
jgi:hypothetical protein